MKRTWLEIYGLAVCFFTAGYFLFVSAEAIWHVVEFSAPEFTMDSYQWERHQTDDAFKQSLMDQHESREGSTRYTPPEGDALTRAREESLERAIKSEARTGFQQLIRNLIGLGIAGLLFVVHWRIAVRARVA